MLDFITWNVSPTLFDGFITIRWYSLMFVIGFTVGYEIVARMFKHEGAPEKWLSILLIYVVIATIVGARLGHVFFYDWDVYKADPIKILYVWEGGLASHGGTIAIILAVILFSIFVTKRNPLWTFDRLVVAIALVGGLIRIGNLFNSEIYGTPTTLPWGFMFVRSREWHMLYEGLPVHPTQIYEALCYFLLFGLLMWMYWKKNAEERPWLMTGIFFLVTFGSRFIIEYVKNVQVPWEVQMRADWGIDQGQLLSIPFILLGIGMIIYAMVKPRQHWKFPNRFSDADEKK